MKRCEVYGNIDSKMFGDPIAHTTQFILRVVGVRNEQIGELEPNLGFMFEIDEGVEHGLKMGRRDPEIKFFGEGFEVNIGRIHVFEEWATSFRGDVASSNSDRFDTEIMTCQCCVDSVFCPNYRIVVGEGNTAAVGFVSGLSDGLGGGDVAEAFYFSRFRDIPVLAELATEIAACGTKGKNWSAWQEMIKRFFFDGVDTEACASAVGIENHLAIAIFANEAKAFITWIEVAMSGAQLAENFLGRVR